MERMTFIIVFIVFLAAQINWAQVPRTLNYQGVLTDGSSVIVPDGNYNVTFRIYQDQTGGSAIWEEAQLISVSSGIFNVVLGSVIPLNIPFDNQYYFGVSVGAGTELTPRIQFTASAYSLNSSNSEKVNNIEASTTPSPNKLLPLENTGNFPTSVVPQTKMDGVRGNTNLNITSTSNIEILNLEIPDAGTKDVFLTGDVIVETSNSTTGRYEFTIRKGSITGQIIGRGWWRVVNEPTGGSIAETVTFSGVDKNVTGPTIYYLVGRKFDSDVANALVFIYSLNTVYIVK